MLCDKCSNIEFRRSTPEDDLCYGKSRAEYVYCDHHANQRALKVSKEYCHLCWKLWHGFKDLYSFSKKSSAQLFEESAPLPIRLSMWLKDDWITSRTVDKIWNGEIFNATCGELRLATSVRPWSIEEPLIPLIHTRSTACNPPQHVVVDSTTISPTNMRLAHLWLENCRQNHQPCRKSNQNSTLPQRVLDVSDTSRVKLVSGNGQLAAYATLSYKWGTGQKYLMTSKNKTHLKTGVPTDTLPLTFADAVRIANALRFTYLWIDAICIQQDSVLELNEQIAAMGDIYSRSTLTLFAAAAVSSQAGIGVTRDPILIQPTNIHISARVGDWSMRREFYVDIFNDETWQGRKPHGRISKDELPLFQRGWVLQEEILSSRGLLFTDEQMEWRCLCDYASEHHPGSIAGEIKDADEKNSDKFGGLRLWLLDEDPLPEQHWYDCYKRRSVIDAWYRMVEGYSTRQLSFASDVLPAISGIASTLHHLKGYAYYAGLWGEDIQLGLLWRVTPFYGDYDPYRRSTQIQPSEIDANSSLARKVKTKLPSWSWISQFGNGSKITFEHKRRYKREKFGLQVMDIKIAYPPLAKNVFGEVLGAKLTVNAITKWAELRGDYNGTRHCSATGHYQSAYKLYDLTRVSIHEQKSSPYLAEFWPDDLNLSLGGTGKLYVLCVLCTIAPAHYDATLKTPTMITAIGVVPSWEHKGSYKRIGLAEFHKNNWFWPNEGWCEGWEFAADAERFTLDLI